MNSMTKSQCGGNSLFGQLQSFTDRSQDSNLGGAKEEAMAEDAYWLTPSAQAVSYATQDYLPRDGSSHSELGLPTSINTKENASQSCRRKQSILSGDCSFC